MRQKIHLHATALVLCAAVVPFSMAARGEETANPPVVVGFTPASGPAGTTVVISGGNFKSLKFVTFNTRSASYTLNTPTQITAVVPSGATTGKIQVIGQYGVGTSAASFTVTAGDGGGGSNPPPPPPPPPGPNLNPPPHVNPPATAVTTHPRLWLTQGDIPRLQSWAVSANPIYQDLLAVANKAKSDMDLGLIQKYDNGDGEGNSTYYPVEQYMELFAFMSLIEVNPTLKADYTKRAHDLLMYVMNQAVLGPAAGMPYRTPHFANYNRSRWFGEAFPLTLDWCYASFTPAEKAVIRQVFIRWVQDNLQGYQSITPIGLVNDPQLLTTGKLRWSGNNYWCNHARQIGMLSLAMDAADDVPTNPTDPPASYLRDYIGNCFGAWLYTRYYAETHDLAGGVSPEGTMYSESSFSGLTMLMLALRTAGVDDPATFGPHAKLAETKFWQQDVLDAYANAMSPQTTVQWSWFGPSYLPASFGDSQGYQTIDWVRVFGPLAIYDINTGNTPRLDKLRWMQNTYAPGGVAFRSSRLRSCLTNYGSLLPMLYFMMYDPTAPAAADPRPNMAPEHFAPGLGRIVARTDWGPNAAWFTYKLSYLTIDHQRADGNMFEFYRNGEWLTKELAAYGNTAGSSAFKNTLSLENNAPVNPQWYSVPEYNWGSQWSYMNSGDGKLLASSITPSYVYAQGDATKLYNAVSYQSTDILHASRSILWLKPDYVVVYDRATSKTAGRYKRFCINTQNQGVVNGSLTTVTTPKGQKLFVNTLLPANAQITTPATSNPGGEVAQGEFMQYRVVVEDPSKPQNARFLHVLQGANSGASAAPVSLIQSTSGTPFDGAVVNELAVMFQNDLAMPFTGVTYTAPAGVTGHRVTGLTPGAGYFAITQPVPGGVLVTVTPGGPLTADTGGVLSF